MLWCSMKNSSRASEPSRKRAANTRSAALARNCSSKLLVQERSVHRNQRAEIKARGDLSWQHRLELGRRKLRLAEYGAEERVVGRGVHPAEDAAREAR